MAIIDGLVSYYKLDEVAGVNAEDSHGANDGTANDARVFTSAIAGIINTGADFSQGNDDIQLNTIIIPATGPFTIQAWINHNSVGVTRTIFGQYIVGHANRFICFLDGGDNVYFQIGGILGAPVVIPTGSWEHLVFVREVDNTTRIYHNGVEIDSIANATNVLQVNSEIASSNAGRYWDKYMDEIAIWLTAKTPAEVLALYNAGNGLPYPFVPATNMQINIADVWKDVNSIQINIGDVWKDVAGVQINIGDVWKDVF